MIYSMFVIAYMLLKNGFLGIIIILLVNFLTKK